MALPPKQATQVERIGIHFEKIQFPPLSARIMALLLIAEPPYCSFDEIIENLQSSKSSVSSALNMLLRDGLIDYMTFPGDKKRYFYINSETWIEMAKRRVEQLAPFREILVEVAHTRTHKHPDFNQMLLEMNQFYGEIEEALTAIIRRWAKKPE
ncbi:hypothetical protein DXT99_18830 [Pontibacter diazotrophicus]|uniref:MarR family transcriptional regulator n=1 Tax=Pontibacter diazotrophicus TaxID=1400979 RepID=A0A3D8L898_9BACT|nr:hypothetical protein [Pontibacter diazotrophicus]RDV13594.1 hypothetical protein DXT99_18830 [Pontibacter diazotrophicus]